MHLCLTKSLCIQVYATKLMNDVMIYAIEFVKGHKFD